MRLFDKINTQLIFKKHIQTFYNYGEANSTGVRNSTTNDQVAFIYFPIIASILIFTAGIRINNDYINIAITSLSIFVGLLFNLLILIFDLAKKQKQIMNDLRSREEIIPQIESAKYLLIKEVFINISFSIALSIISIIAVLLPCIKPKFLINYLQHYEGYWIIKLAYLAITNCLAFFLIIEFLFVLLMILKRFFLIFNSEINN